MLNIVKIEKDNLKERILAVHCNNDIYIGLGNKFLNYSKKKILCIHEKSIRSISGNENYIGCSSYDGTATVFDSKERYLDKIEGPDTEIKGIAFDERFMALTTRGKTTWILEDFEISKILDDHTQDVKGCTFNKGRLYTWSYDNSIKVYDLFEIDHSWEFSQSIDLESIVWKVVFFEEYLCACLHNGNVVFMKQEGPFWETYQTIRMSLTPIYACALTSKHIGFICNRNSLLFLDLNLEKICEVPDLNSGCDVFSCSFSKNLNSFVVGSEDGCLSIVEIEES